MIDLSTLKSGDRIEYRPSELSDPHHHTRCFGTYVGQWLWSPRDRPAEVWVDLLREGPCQTRRHVYIPWSQITAIFPAEREREHD